MAKRKKPNQSKALPESSSAVVDEEHDQLITWVNESEDATIWTRDTGDKCRRYYDSDPWTDEEKAKLKSQKQSPVVVNRCKPKVDSLMGMEHANRTTAKAFPRTPKHTQGATAATEAVRFVLDDNQYSRVRADTWENMLIEGTGGIEIIVKPKGDSYKIVLGNIPWDRLIYDPHNRRKDFAKPKYLGQVIWMDYDDAAALYPQAKDILESMESNSTTYDDRPRWMDTTRRRVKIVELYYRKDDGDWWYACFTRGGYCKPPQVSPYKNEEGETEHPYEFASLFVTREGGRYGSLFQVLDIQDEIDKRRSKFLHLMSVRQTFGTKGAVEDLNKARQELAKPDGHVEFAYGELNKDFGVLPTGDMAQSQFNLLTEAKMEMDIVGANAATMGKDKTVQSGVALRQRALTGQTELAPMFDVLKNLDIRVYRKIWNRVKQYWKSEMWLRVTDDENNLKFVGLNKPVTKGEQMLQQAQSQGAPPEILAQLQQQIAADPMMKEVVSTENDIVNLDVDIVMDDAPDTVTQEVEDFQAMAEMVKSGFPLPPEAVIMASPLSNKDKIIKMMREQPQVSPQHQKQMEDFQKQMEDLKKQAQKLAEENQKLKLDRSVEAQQMQADAAAEGDKLKLQKEKQDQEYDLKKRAAERDAGLARAKALDEFNLKCECAERDQKLQREELEFKKSLEAEKKMMEQKTDNETQAESLAPQLIQSLQAMIQEFAQVIQNQQEFQTKLLQQLAKPKTVELAGIRRNDAGMIAGASATIQ